MSEYIDVKLRVKNTATYAGTPYRNVTLITSGIPPSYSPHPDGERTPGPGGRKFQNIVQTLSWTAYVLDYSVVEGAWDHGHYEHVMDALLGEHIWIEEVTGSQRVNRDAADVVSPYWPDVVPVEVTAIYEGTTYKPEIGGFAAVITFESVYPRIGTVIT